MEKILKSLYLKKLTCPKKENLKFVEMFLVMMARKYLNPFLIKLIIIKKPLTSHLYLYSERARNENTDSEENMERLL